MTTYNIPETIKNIDELFSEEKKQFDKNVPEITIPDSTEAEINFASTNSNHLHYKLSKLFEKHPVFGIDYFKRKFYNDKQLIEELLNMESNISDDLEYYSSYEYLFVLLKRKRYES